MYLVLCIVLKYIHVYVHTYIAGHECSFIENNKRKRRRANVDDIYEIRRDENNYISPPLLPPHPPSTRSLIRYRAIENAYQTINRVRK